MTETARDANVRRRRGRSPSYPAIDLETAIDRARVLYGKERQYHTAPETVARHWSYKSLNGPAALSLAALKKFGLMEDEGVGPDRRVWVTDLAVDILANPDPADRLAAIKDAALRPPIHRELWDKYGSERSDEALKWELIRERGFTETGASEFVPQYKATITFAGLDAGDRKPTQTRNTQENKASVRRTPLGQELHGDSLPPGDRRSARQRRPSEEASTYAVPVAVGSDVVIEGPFPLSEQEWSQFIAVLTAMKPGLVSDSAQERQPGPVDQIPE